MQECELKWFDKNTIIYYYGIYSTMERWNGIKEVARVTGVAALEGAVVGSLLLGLPGIFAGGIVGGVTALVAEGVGRGVKINVDGDYTITSTVTCEGALVYKKDTEITLTGTRVPWIQASDFLLHLTRQHTPHIKTNVSVVGK